MRVALTTVGACEGCGACCAHIGLPPFEVPNPDLGPLPAVRPVRFDNDQSLAQDVLDTELFLAMPAALRAEHAAAVAALDRDPSGTPCAWLDPATRRCRHYEWRPAACRDWVPGGEGCNAARFRGSKVLWKYPLRVDQWWNPRAGEWFEVDAPPPRDSPFWSESDAAWGGDGVPVDGWDHGWWADAAGVAWCAAVAAGVLLAWHAAVG